MILIIKNEGNPLLLLQITKRGEDLRGKCHGVVILVLSSQLRCIQISIA